MSDLIEAIERELERGVDETLGYLEGALRPLGAPVTVEDAVHENWRITGLETAAWASRKAAAARRKQAEVTAWAEGEKDRIDAVARREAQRFEDDATFFEHHLADYLRREIADGRKTKSLELPGGTIKLTARPARLDVDDAAFIEWAKAAGRVDLVRVKTTESLDKTALKKAATLAENGVVVIDGEVIPGARWEAQEDSVSFSVAEEQGLFGSES